jgi:hypothetical protein
VLPILSFTDGWAPNDSNIWVTSALPLKTARWSGVCTRNKI